MQIVEVVDIPMAYVSEYATRLKIKAVGDMRDVLSSTLTDEKQDLQTVDIANMQGNN